MNNICENMQEKSLLCKLIDNKCILFNSSSEFIVDKTTFTHYLNYKRIIKPSQLIKFILHPHYYIEHTIKYLNNNNSDLRNDNIVIDYNYENPFTLHINLTENYGIIKIDNHIIKTDIDVILDFKNKNNVFTYNKQISKYPYYSHNNQNIDLLEYIIGIRKDNLNITFKDNNIYNLCKSNIEYKHVYHKNIIQQYPNAQYITGHFKDNGKDAYIMKNPMWKINNIYYIYCDNDYIININEKSLSIIRDFEKKNNIVLTYHKHSNGYIVCNPCKLYIHQIIMDCYGNGKGTKNISVDHIDQNPLNNCYENLRIADRKTQEQNSKGIKEGTKKNRHKFAQELPEGLTHDMMPKYVNYNKECYNKEKQLYREFFRIEHHPKLNKIWSSSKSTKISILDKLKETINVLHNLEQNIYPYEEQKNRFKFPTYISLKTTNNKKMLIYDKRVSTQKRETLKMILPENYNIEEQIKKFENKIKDKYGYN